MSYSQCTKECKKNDSPCNKDDCRNWMDYGEDLNCVLIATERHGPMTLDEISKRLGLSLVRIKQIEEAALIKLKKRNNGLVKELLHE
jgi:hypothetical protein